MTDPQLPTPVIEGAAELFRVLGHETRLRLLLLLAAGERSVGALEQVSGIGQPGLSQQLAILRKAQLVLTRRVAKQVYYRIDPTAITPVADMLARFANTATAPVSAAETPARTPARTPDEQQPDTARSAAGFARML